ncbi:hypothetical protein BO443_130111 [Burkholderia orbicola]
MHPVPVSPLAVRRARPVRAYSRPQPDGVPAGARPARRAPVDVGHRRAVRLRVGLVRLRAAAAPAARYRRGRRRQRRVHAPALRVRDDDGGPADRREFLRRAARDPCPRAADLGLRARALRRLARVAGGRVAGAGGCVVRRRDRLHREPLLRTLRHAVARAGPEHVADEPALRRLPRRLRDDRRPGRRRQIQAAPVRDAGERRPERHAHADLDQESGRPPAPRDRLRAVRAPDPAGRGVRRQDLERDEAGRRRRVQQVRQARAQVPRVLPRLGRPRRRKRAAMRESADLAAFGESIDTDASLRPQSFPSRLRPAPGIRAAVRSAPAPFVPDAGQADAHQR